MPKQFGFVKLLKPKKKFNYSNHAVSRKKSFSNDGRRIKSPSVNQIEKQPFEAVLDESPSWNPFEHKDPSDIYDDPFDDGVMLRLFDTNKGSKARGRTGNLFGF